MDQRLWKNVEGCLDFGNAEDLDRCKGYSITGLCHWKQQKWKNAEGTWVCRRRPPGQEQGFEIETSDASGWWKERDLDARARNVSCVQLAAVKHYAFALTTLSFLGF